MLSTPGIFNVLDPWYYNGTSWVGMQAHDSTLATARQNAAVLQKIIDLAQTTDKDQTRPYGAIILFPGHNDVPDPDTGTGDGLGCLYSVAVPLMQPLNAAIIIQCNWPLLLKGTGNVVLSMVLDEGGSSGDMFSIQTNGTVPLGDGTVVLGDNTGGITFEDLTFEYADISGQTDADDWAAIRTIWVDPKGGAKAVRLIRCVLQNCPIGVWFEQSTDCALHDCQILYSTNYGTGVKLGNGETIGDGGAAKQISITDCLFNGNSKSTAMRILGSDHVRVSNCQIDTFLNGILITPGYGNNAVRHTFTAVSVYVGDNDGAMGNACLLQGLIPGGYISQITFVGCYFELGESAMPTMDMPGICVDSADSGIDTVRFVSCHSQRFPGPGLKLTSSGEANGPTNIEVLGGMYSGNRYHNGDVFTSDDNYGIYVDDATGVRISGVSCVGHYPLTNDAGSPSPSPQQDVGIYINDAAADVTISGCDLRLNGENGIRINAASGVTISGCDASSNDGIGILVNGGASDVTIDACDVRANSPNGVKVDGSSTAVSDILIRNCNARGYGAGAYATAINVTGSTANVETTQVTDCAGYNDQGAHVRNTPPTSATTFHGYDYGYFGPVEFYAFQGTGAGSGTISEIDIDGTNVHLLSGSFYLAPQESAKVTWTAGGGGTAIFFNMFGK